MKPIHAYCTKYITNVSMLCISIRTKHTMIYMEMLNIRLRGRCSSSQREMATEQQRQHHQQQKNRPYPFPEHHVTFAKGLICYLFPICTVARVNYNLLSVLHIHNFSRRRYDMMGLKEIQMKSNNQFEIQHHNAILLNYNFIYVCVCVCECG